MIYEFAATQDLHGYDKPWAPGAGKNKYDIEGWLEQIECDYTKNGNSYVVNPVNSKLYTEPFIFSEFDTPCTLSIAGLSAGTAVAPRIELTESDGITGWALGVGSESYTSHEAANIRYNWTTMGSFTITAPMLEFTEAVPTAPTAFAPYSNICPPEGFNIWDPNNSEFIQVYAGYVNANTREMYLRPVYEEYAGEELVGPWMSSLDEYSEEATPTTGAFVIDFGGELTSFEITPFMLQTLLDSLGIRQHFTDGAGLLNSLMDQAQGRVRSEEELLHLSRPLKVIPIGDQLPAGLKIRPISKDVLPGLPGKFIR